MTGEQPIVVLAEDSVETPGPVPTPSAPMLPEGPFDLNVLADMVAERVAQRLASVEGRAVAVFDEDRLRQTWLDGFNAMDENQKVTILKTERNMDWLVFVEPHVRGAEQMLAYFSNPVFHPFWLKELITSNKVELNSDTVRIIWSRAKTEGVGEFFDWTVATLTQANPEIVSEDIKTSIIAMEEIDENAVLPWLKGNCPNRVLAFLSRKVVLTGSLGHVLEHCGVDRMTSSVGRFSQIPFEMFVKHLERIGTVQAKALWLGLIEQMGADGLSILGDGVEAETIPTLPNEVLTALSLKNKDPNAEKTVEASVARNRPSAIDNLNSEVERRAIQLLLKWIKVRLDARQAETELNEFELGLLGTVRAKGEKGVIALIGSPVIPQSTLDEIFEAVRGAGEDVYGSGGIRKALAQSERITDAQLLILAEDRNLEVRRVIIGRLGSNQVSAEIRDEVIRKLLDKKDYLIDSLAEVKSLPEDVKLQLAKVGPRKFRGKMLHEALDAISSKDEVAKASGVAFLRAVFEGESVDGDNLIKPMENFSHSASSDGVRRCEIEDLLKRSDIDEDSLKILLGSSERAVPSAVAKHLIESARTRGGEVAMCEYLLGLDKNLYEIVGVVAEHAQDPAVLSRLLDIVEAGTAVEKAIEVAMDAAPIKEDRVRVFREFQADTENWHRAQVARNFSNHQLLDNPACTVALADRAFTIKGATINDLGGLLKREDLPAGEVLALVEKFRDPAVAHAQAEAADYRSRGHGSLAESNEEALKKLDKMIGRLRKRIEKERFDEVMSDPFGALELAGERGAGVIAAMEAMSEPIDGLVGHLMQWEDKEVNGEVIDLRRAVTLLVDKIFFDMRTMTSVAASLLLAVLVEKFSDSAGDDLGRIAAVDDKKAALISFIVRKIGERKVRVSETEAV